MSMYDDILTGAAALLVAFLITLGQVRITNEALADRIAPQILRLHIVANSDSAADQAIKLEVRSLVLDRVRQWIRTEKPANKSEAVAYINSRKNVLADAIHDFLTERGYSCHADVRLTRSRFPPRQYGNLVLPEGTYDAVRVVLGAGNGHNWWCVLYPGFCFVDEACEGAPDETLASFLEHLNRDDRLALLDHRPDIQICFRFLPFLNPKQEASPAKADEQSGQ